LTFKAGFEVFIKAIRFLQIYRGTHGQSAVQKVTLHGTMYRTQRASGEALYHLMVLRSLKNFGRGFVGRFANTDMS
jgi:hypothetical protein